MKYSVCLPAVFRDVPPADALRRAANIGFKKYELWSWWDIDFDALLRAQAETGAMPSAILTPIISLTQPERREEYIDGLKRTIAACGRLGCDRIISQVGNAVEGVSREKQHACIAEGLRRCRPILEDAGIQLLIEPLNTKIDHIGYYLWQAKEGFELVDEAGGDAVKLLYDIYHQFVMDDINMEEIRANIDKIAHFHIAGYPGRNEPLETRIDYAQIISGIREAGYEGDFGLEYMPVGKPEDGLKDILASGWDK